MEAKFEPQSMVFSKIKFKYILFYYVLMYNTFTFLRRKPPIHHKEKI